MDTCIFCRIIRGELPSYPVAETDDAVAFLDIHPATKGHTLVVPKRHRQDLLDASEQELASLVVLAQRVGAVAMSELGAPGVLLHQVSGVAAGQDVFHLHFHVIPRYHDDTLHPSWNVPEGHAPDLNDAQQNAVAGQLRHAITNVG